MRFFCSVLKYTVNMYLAQNPHSHKLDILRCCANIVYILCCV